MILDKRWKTFFSELGGVFPFVPLNDVTHFYLYKELGLNLHHHLIKSSNNHNTLNTSSDPIVDSNTRIMITTIDYLRQFPKIYFEAIWKNVLIIDITFINDCILNKKILPFDNYLILNPLFSNYLKGKKFTIVTQHFSSKEIEIFKILIESFGGTFSIYSNENDLLNDQNVTIITPSLSSNFNLGINCVTTLELENELFQVREDF